MTPEEKAKNVALLARVVMGWTYLDAWGISRQPGCFILSRSGDGHAIAETQAGHDIDWDPYTNIADAMGVLEKFEDWQLYHADANKEPAKYWCVVWDDRVLVNDGRIVEPGASPQYAICAACLEWARAQGGKG